MPYKFYNYLGLIQSNSNATLAALTNVIKKHFSDDIRQIHISDHATGIVITIDDYNFKISYQENENVLIESKEIATIYTEDYVGNPIDKDVIEKCERRFEMGGESDFNMDYFNDSLFIIQCMEELGKITVINLN
jgi:hypothetical protein